MGFPLCNGNSLHNSVKCLHNATICLDKKKVVIKMFFSTLACNFHVVALIQSLIVVLLAANISCWKAINFVYCKALANNIDCNTDIEAASEKLNKVGSYA